MLIVVVVMGATDGGVDVDVGMDKEAGAVGVEGVDVMDVVLMHEGLSVGVVPLVVDVVAWGFVEDEANDAFVDAVEGKEVGMG